MGKRSDSRSPQADAGDCELYPSLASPLNSDRSAQEQKGTIAILGERCAGKGLPRPKLNLSQHIAPIACACSRDPQTPTFGCRSLQGDLQLAAEFLGRYELRKRAKRARLSIDDQCLARVIVEARNQAR